MKCRLESSRQWEGRQRSFFRWLNLLNDLTFWAQLVPSHIFLYTPTPGLKDCIPMLNCKMYQLINIDRLIEETVCLFVLQAFTTVYYDLVAAKAIGTFESQPQKALLVRYTSFEVTEHGSRLHLAGRTIMRVLNIGSGV